MTLAELLKQSRKNMKLNQTKAAKLIGVSQGTISKYESAHLEPTLRDAFSISIIYKISMARIFGALMKTNKGKTK